MSCLIWSVLPALFTEGSEVDEQHDAYDPHVDEEVMSQIYLVSFGKAFGGMEPLWKHEDGVRLVERPPEGGTCWNLGHRYKLWLESQGRGAVHLSRELMYFCKIVSTTLPPHHSSSFSLPQELPNYLFVTLVRLVVDTH